MKKLITLAITVLLAAPALFAQAFEGIIEFDKITPRDTTHYKYFVKGNNVRLEETGSKGQVSGIMLIDLKAKTVTALSPDRKLYMDVENKNPAKVTGTPEITKTTNTKTIAGYKCTQWRIKNKEENTEISYFVADGKFDFFVPLLKVLNRKDKTATYFLQVPENAGVFTMEATERSLTREERVRLETTKVEKKAVDKKMFEIPKDFAKYQK